LEFTDWMLLKAAAFLVVIAVVGFWQGFTGR
jgi:hypothetical protein